VVHVECCEEVEWRSSCDDFSKESSDSMELGNWCELGGLVVGGFWVASSSVLPRLQNFRYLQIWGLGRIVQCEQEKNRCCDDQSRGYPHRH
jgi:hypothetical protein